MIATITPGLRHPLSVPFTTILCQSHPSTANYLEDVFYPSRFQASFSIVALLHLSSPRLAISPVHLYFSSVFISRGKTLLNLLLQYFQILPKPQLQSLLLQKDSRENKALSLLKKVESDPLIGHGCDGIQGEQLANLSK